MSLIVSVHERIAEVGLNDAELEGDGKRGTGRGDGSRPAAAGYGAFLLQGAAP
jgi:hypothetical protein